MEAKHRQRPHGVLFSTGNRSEHRHGRGRWDVVGHTDNSGSREANAALSLARAQWVSQHLVDALGWKAEDVVARGLGSTEPMGTNPAQNRRVEVRWVPSLQ